MGHGGLATSMPLSKVNAWDRKARLRVHRCHGGSDNDVWKERRYSVDWMWVVGFLEKESIGDPWGTRTNSER